MENCGKKVICLHPHGLAVLLQCDEYGRAIEREVRECCTWLEEEKFDGLSDDAGEGRPQ